MIQVKRDIWSILFIGAAISSCVIHRPTPPAPPPTTFCFAPTVTDKTSHQPVASAAVAVEGVMGTTNVDGYVYLQVPATIKPTHVIIAKDGYQAFDQPYVVNSWDCDAPITLTPSRKITNEAGALRVQGEVFVTDSGVVWQPRGISDFLLFAKFLAGQNIDAILDQRVTLGRNYVRVFGTLASWGNPYSAPSDGIVHLYPQEHGDYYDKLAAFASYLELWRIRLEFVVFADGQIVMPDVNQRRGHLDRVVSMLANRWNVTVEVANEPFKNLPGGDKEAADEARRVKGLGVLVAAGDVSQRAWGDAIMPAGDYGTIHTERKDEWPRTAKDIFDLRSATRSPWWADEPMGASVNNKPGSRSNVPEDFGWYGGTTALFGGGLFHCDSCIFSDVIPDGLELEAAKAFDMAQRWVPAEAQTWPYQRGGNCGDCDAIGGMPLQQYDLPHPQGTLRTFCKGNGSTEWCVAIRPADGWTPQPRAGWAIDQHSVRGLVKLTR